jgi:general nucleoside transport system permease protein
MNIPFLVQQTMFFAIPLLVVALGGMFSEQSGVINIGLEGIMIFSTFMGILVLNMFIGVIPAQFLFILALLVAGISGMIFSSLHAYASVYQKANQVISGTALNMFAPAFFNFTMRNQTGSNQLYFFNQYRIPKVPLLGDIPVLGPLFFTNTYISTYIGLLILAISVFVFYKTRFGLRLRACGEHPQAADAAGINVYRMRTYGVLISGLLAGMGGLILTIPTTTAFGGSVAGYGFLALAVLIFGQWKPSRIVFAAFFFGFMKTIAATYTSIPLLVGLGIPGYLFKSIPYLTTIFVLAFTSKKSVAPKALGEPYDKGKR